MKLPRAVLIALGVSPIVALMVLLTWATFRTDANPGSLAVYDSTGEVSVQGRSMPPFSLTLHDGTAFDSEQIRGKAVLVDFWASWCPPCRAEASGLERAWQHYRARGDVAFVGVAIWDKDDKVTEFLARTGTSYTIGKDPRGAIAVEFGVTGIPEKYIISREGRVLRKFVGPMDEMRLRKVLDEALGLSKQ